MNERRISDERISELSRADDYGGGEIALFAKDLRDARQRIAELESERDRLRAGWDREYFRKLADAEDQCESVAAGSQPDGDGALEFLKRAADGNHRIVSSSDLTTLQIAEAQACNRFYIEPGGGLGWALLPWEFTTDKDRKRESAPSSLTLDEQREAVRLLVLSADWLDIEMEEGEKARQDIKKFVSRPNVAAMLKGER